MTGVTATATRTGTVLVPVRVISAMPFANDSLMTVSRPVNAHKELGSNFVLSVTSRLGFNVAGNSAHDMVGPAPLNIAPLTVTRRIPVGVKVTGCVGDAFTTTSPKAMLVALILSASITAFNSVKFLHMLPALAVTVAA